MLSKDFTFSKRQLGLLLLLTGAAGFLGILAIDVLDVGREGGIGPAQQIALGLMVVMVVMGISLIPCGKEPA